jgi:hypothetical protein
MAPLRRIHKLSKTGSEWELHIAIARAMTDSREAPWYAAWNIVLKDFLFASFCPEPFFTITYPQFPVSNTADTYDLRDELLPDLDSDNEESDDDQELIDLTSQPPSSPPHSTMEHTAAPSPESSRRSSSSEARRAFQRNSAPSPESLSSSRAPLSRPRIKRSTRIPDFAQLVYRLCINPDNTVNCPVELDHRIILLVENKPRLDSPTEANFTAVLGQTDEQARHAFASFPNLTTLGVIIAVGPYWTYVEYDSADIPPSRSKSEQKDPTYMDTTPPPTKLHAKAYHPIRSLFEPHGFACLETDLSNKGFKIIRDRMKFLTFPSKKR